jgi:lysylphosphatidylglycerol synthetase-like protein (DUF2156 family)
MATTALGNATVLGNALDFFQRLGVFDVVLPFLLVFTMMFAVLERTKVLGTETRDKKEYTRKNLNAMVSFTIAFLVLASSKLVETITSVSSNIIILVMLGVFFLLTVGAFMKEGEVGTKGLPSGPLRTFFIVLMLVGIIVIFLNALKTEDGRTWWDVTWDYVNSSWDSTVFASCALVVFVIIFVAWLSKGEKKPAKEPKEGGTES